jgi:hypothetical protein
MNQIKYVEVFLLIYPLLYFPPHCLLPGQKHLTYTKGGKALCFSRKKNGRGKAIIPIGKGKSESINSNGAEVYKENQIMRNDRIYNGNAICGGGINRFRHVNRS